MKKLLSSKEFREAYVFEHLKRSIPFQVRTMRTEREWSQAKAGAEIGKPQNVVSRLESPAYGKLTLQTLLDVARGFDVGLVIKFVPFSRLVKEYEDVSFEALSAKSVEDKEEARKLEEWAAEEKRNIELTPAARRVVVDAEHLFPGTPATRTSAEVNFLPGMFPVEVSKPNAPRLENKRIITATTPATERVSVERELTTLRKASGV